VLDEEHVAEQRLYKGSSLFSFDSATVVDFSSKGLTPSALAHTSDLVFMKQHVWNAIFHREWPACLWTDELAVK
jgi:hypothetical protein